MNIKMLIWKVKERLYFKDIDRFKVRMNTLVIRTDDDPLIPQDKNAYHEYYLKFRKSA